MRAVKRSTFVGGFVFLAVSAALYLATRAWLVTVWDRQDLEISVSLSIGIVLCALSIAAAFIGTGLLFHRRAARLILAIAHVVLCLPTLAGSILNAWDYLSASGYNGFGTVIFILVGNNLLPVAAGLSVGTGAVKAALLMKPAARPPQPGA